MLDMDPCIFQFEIAVDGAARAGFGVIAAYVPTAEGWPAVMVLANDPCHDPGRPIETMVPAAIQYVLARTGFAEASLCCVAIDAWGRFAKVVPHWGGSPTPAVARIEFERFKTGNGVESFLAETGAAGEVALEMLASVGEAAGTPEETPTALEFLGAVEAHGNLPVPGAIFRQVQSAIAAGDARRIATLLQSDPVIAASLINYANAAKFAGGGRTSSILKAVQRLGIDFVQRVVFVASMMMRYRKGRCAAFDYRGYWMNAIATGSAMRALMPQFRIPDAMADDAFAAGLVSSIGWLAVSETYPALMAKYLDRCGSGDPLTKIRAQREIFPCSIRLVSERYLELFSFPEIVLATVAGKATDQRNWGECLAHAMRAAQRLAPFDCLAVLPLAEVPPPCLKEWGNWQDFLAGV